MGHHGQTGEQRAQVSAGALSKDDEWLLNLFAKKARKGCSCVYLGNSESTWGNRVTAHYILDQQMKSLSMVTNAPDADQHRSVSCTIHEILDIYSFPDDGEECFPAEVVRACSIEELELLLMVVYAGEDSGDACSFCFAEDSCESRDTLLDCLRILSMKNSSA